jgi:hypothetical protein
MKAFLSGIITYLPWEKRPKKGKQETTKGTPRNRRTLPPSGLSDIPPPPEVANTMSHLQIFVMLYQVTDIVVDVDVYLAAFFLGS